MGMKPALCIKYGTMLSTALHLYFCTAGNGREGEGGGGGQG